MSAPNTQSVQVAADPKMVAFAKKQNKTASKVLRVLKRHPEAIYDYRLLYFYVWIEEDKLIRFIPPKVVLKLSNPDSIGRNLRKLVEKGTVQLPADLKKDRKLKEGLCRGFFKGRGFDSQSNLDGFFNEGTNTFFCPECSQEVDIDLEECPFCGNRLNR